MNSALLLWALLGIVPTRALAQERSNTAGCEKACTDLSLEFGPYLHYPDNDKDFTIWDAKQQDVRPACRVEPSTSTEVAKVMTILVRNWCRFATKGGGHSRAIDSSNSVGGVTVDMRRVNAIVPNQDYSRAKLGAGLTLGQAYKGLEAYNISNIGGRVESVGLAGFTMGGGFSSLAPKYGFAMDNVFEYEVVLPNSTILTASPSANSDLYFALRGGMNNFGIVTYFTVRTVPQGPRLGGQKVFNTNYTGQVFDEIYKLTTTYVNDSDLSFSCRYLYNQTEDRFHISVTFEYNQPILNPPPFDGLNSIPSEASTVTVDTVTNFAYKAAQSPGQRHLFATLTYHPSTVLDKQIIGIFQDEIQSVKTIHGLRPISMVFQSVHPTVMKAMKERGGSALGIEVEGPLTIVLLTFGWSLAKDDEVMSAFADRWLERSKDAANKAGHFHPWIYINYAKENQDPFSGYGETNKARLKSIQSSIDPMGVFTSRGLVPGFFKLH